MKKDKIYTIVQVECVYKVPHATTGTIEELAKHFHMTLSRLDHPKITTKPRTRRELIRSLKTVALLERGRVNGVLTRDRYKIRRVF